MEASSHSHALWFPQVVLWWGLRIVGLERWILDELHDERARIVNTSDSANLVVR